jgi:hypothetical protein
VGQVTGVHGVVENEDGAYLSKAVGVEARISNGSSGDITDASAFEVAAPSDDGTIDNLYGLKIPNLTEGQTSNYAIHTGQGLTHFGDVIELVEQATPPGTPPAGQVYVYPKSDGKLYAKDDAGTEYDLTGGGGGGGSSTATMTGTAGVALSERDYVYLDAADDKWRKVDSDADPVQVSAIRGVVTESGGIASDATGEITVLGKVSGFTGLTAWAPIFVDVTAGAFTQTHPSVSAGGGQKAIIRVGYAVSATEVMLEAHPILFVKRESLADDASLTVEHADDPQARGRTVHAYITTTATGSSVESYAESNQDVQVPLEAQAASGGTTSVSASNGLGGFGDAGNVDRWRGQSFKVNAGRLSQIKVDLGANNGSPTGTATWRIETDSSGSPSGTVLASDTWTPTPSQTNTINITDGPLLEADTTYWLVLKSTAPQELDSGRQWQWYRSSSNIYADGKRGFRDDGSWTFSTAEDHSFEVTTDALDGNDALGQSIQLSSAADVESVKLWLKKVGSPTGNLTLKIYSDASGEPDTVISNGTSDTVAASALSTSFGWITFTFANVPALSASTTYWLVLETTDSASTDNFVEWGADESSPSYANGEMKALQSSTWVAESKDAVFDIFAAGTIFDEPVLVGRFSGGNRDVAVRYDDGSGDAGDTQTTFKNVSGGTLDVTCVVEL